MLQDIFAHIQASAPQRGGEFGSKLRVYKTSSAQGTSQGKRTETRPGGKFIFANFREESGDKFGN